MKRIIIAIVSVITLVIGIASFASSQDITVKVDGKTIAFPDARPFIDSKSNRTMIPVRFVAENLGCKVDWNSELKVVYINKNGILIELKIGVLEAIADGKVIALDAKAVIKEDRTFVPLRFVSEALGANVEWNGSTRTVYITTGKTSPTLAPKVTPAPTSIVNEEYKKIADMIRTVIELEMAKEWDKVYNYLSPESLKKKGITSKDGFEKKYVKLSGSYNNLMKLKNLKECYTKCLIEKINDTKVRVIYGVYGYPKPDGYAMYYDSRNLVKIDSKWYIDIEPIIVKNTEPFLYEEGY
ncbi:copper amine oxidase N-terminal domain-containing protein [Pseudobacteroides cellulosolvens]|uniref:Copper amine oxidase-like domain-containing protein n=1 Tax=Pseudobacteroides cellulosolvens ATCC 35603 = DSM 2933 TaxID=398512 RepID=A0A0L6JU11_9FIRM|nr:copper amine oxidase N-terminal domain-containing protein [Pseudobacteroides cellulosolvens]KNY29165.1 copper amine oxidase-like domain-containing protein [Pseudobacteroides cellulosolvens ATCC 35603 = DSM 2933]